jgi:FkbM family methyltransferase
MIGIELFRRFRDSSRLGKGMHSFLRGPYYSLMSQLYPRGVPIHLPGRCSVKLHPRMLGIRPERYEPELGAFIERRVSTGMCVLDIGAHVGLHTLRFCQRVGPSGRVIAVEPSPANANALRDHLSWNGCEHASVIQAAIGDTVGEIRFAYRPDAFDAGGFANSIAYDVGGSQSVIPVTTIDEICRDLAPNFIKIDVEGAEMLALQGGELTFRQHSPVLLVAIHPEAMGALNSNPAQLVTFLEGFGYVARHLDGSAVTRSPGFEELIFTKDKI